MKNDTTSSLVPGEAITFGVHAFWDMSIEWKKSINQEDSHHKTCLSCVAPWCGPGSGPGHHTWNEPELTLDYKGEICWRTEWNCQHHLCEDETIYCLVCGCCLAGAADLTRHRKYCVILRVSCVLSPVCRAGFHYSRWSRGFCATVSQTRTSTMDVLLNALF